MKYRMIVATHKNYKTEKCLLRSSYYAAIRIAKANRSFRIGEEQVKSCLLNDVSENFGPLAAQKLK